MIIAPLGPRKHGYLFEIVATFPSFPSVKKEVFAYKHVILSVWRKIQRIVLTSLMNYVLLIFFFLIPSDFLPL